LRKGLLVYWYIAVIAWFKHERDELKLGVFDSDLITPFFFAPDGIYRKP
jgi:hypothetical protein